MTQTDAVSLQPEVCTVPRETIQIEIVRQY